MVKNDEEGMNEFIDFFHNFNLITEIELVQKLLKMIALSPLLILNQNKFKKNQT